MIKAKLFNSGKLSRETILSQAARKLRKVQRPSRKGVGPSGPKQELPHVGNDMVFSAWRHAADGLAVESELASRIENQVGYISYDRDLIRILDEPDPDWASLKEDNPYKIKQVRVAFSDQLDSGIPVGKQHPGYIMNAWVNGKCLGPVSVDMLERNSDGSIRHSSYDIHWSIAERIYEDVREMMDADIQRAAGKVINFCLATGQLILTDRGWIKIEELSACDLLWDGVEWVSHEGLHDSGIREVSYHDGLWATPGHNVWTEGGKIRFAEARTQQIGLVHIGGACGSIESRWPDHLPGDRSLEGTGLLLSDDGVPELRQTHREGATQHGEGVLVKVQMPQGGWSRGLRSTQPSDADIGLPLQRHDAKVLQDDTRIQSGLQGAWNQSAVRESKGLCDVGGNAVAGGNFQGEGLRSQGQQRGLLKRESSAGDALREFVKQAKVGLVGCGARQGVLGKVSASDLHGGDHQRSTEAGILGVGHCNEVGWQQKSRQTQTYDILNAGPRRRFFCAGVLVSNSSAYGASPNSLERKIESDTGVKPEEGVGQKGLDAIKVRQPRATEFLEEMAALPKTKGYYRAASGRIRHCLLHGAGSGVGWRIRNSLESALGRELKNVAMQESVGSTAARACVWSNHIYRKLGLRSRVMTCLYDSLVSICPLEERFVVERIQEAMMSDVNTWTYEDEYGKRVLQYGVDKDFNYRWSTYPSEDEKQQLKDPTWHPTPDKLKHLLTFRNWQLLVS